MANRLAPPTTLATPSDGEPTRPPENVDQCTRCGVQSRPGLMKICAHCEREACDQCGDFVYGPDVDFIQTTDEEKWDRKFSGASSLCGLLTLY